ncbi:hypothetical protein CC2G_004632 [Coprinopsis cinerea AmutBmut pab1-1]|nr:hypothetical protein CC2G_004632 [Coprinopsis cinerea AmutBmut pab1-1]
MARGVGTRSQRQAGPSQSQYGGTQTGRNTRSQRAGPSQTQALDDDDEDDYEDDEHGGPSQGMDVGEGDEEVTTRANDLVRIALFTEQKRMHLRREDITKKVLAPHPKLFKRVFAEAQKILRETFGMEMVELPTRAGLEQSEFASTQGPGAQTQQEEGSRRTTGIKKKAAATASKTYILRSCLNPSLIEIAAQTDNRLLAEELSDLPWASDDEEGGGGDEDERKPTSYGSIISWSHAEQVGSLGILYVVLALILVHGRVLPDADLRSYLKALHLPSTPARAPVHFTSSSPVHCLGTEEFLLNLARQNYIERRVVGESAAKKVAGGKRGRPTQTQRNQDDDGGTREMYEWRWGPRAMCEVGEEAVARFVAEFMITSEGDDDADEEDGEDARPANGRRRGGRQQPQRQSKKDKIQKMFEGIEKAAGGKLAEIR